MLTHDPAARDAPFSRACAFPELAPQSELDRAGMSRMAAVRAAGRRLYVGAGGASVVEIMMVGGFVTLLSPGALF